MGIQLKVTLVDLSIYQERLSQFNYDFILHVIPQSATPGNEQQGMLSSAAAKQPGTFNVAGVCNPVIDEIIVKLIESPDYETLVVRTKALDRALLWGYYMIPAWQPEAVLWVMWDRFGFPDPMCPPYNPVSMTTWWAETKEETAIKRLNESSTDEKKLSFLVKLKKWFF